MKLIASLYKFYDEKQGELPFYFANDVSEFRPAYVDENFSKDKVHLYKKVAMVVLKDKAENLYQEEVKKGNVIRSDYLIFEETEYHYANLFMSLWGELEKLNKDNFKEIDTSLEY